MDKLPSRFKKKQDEFIQLYRSVPPNGLYHSWDAPIWETDRSRNNIRFTKVSAHGRKSKSLRPEHLLTGENGQVLRAYAVHCLTSKNISVSTFTTTQGHRRLCEFLNDRNIELCDLTTALYEDFIATIEGNGNTPHHNMNAANNFLRELQDFQVVNSLIKLRNPYAFRNSNQYVRESKNKLPDETVVLATAEVFAYHVPKTASTISLYDGHIDKVCAAYIAFMLGAPDRINEVHLLETQELQEHFIQDGKEAGEHAGWSLLWRGSKGKGDFRKPFLDVLYRPVSTAISMLNTLGEPARALSRYYEYFPNKSRSLGEVLGNFNHSSDVAGYTEQPVSSLFSLGAILGFYLDSEFADTLEQISGYPFNIDLAYTPTKQERYALFGLPISGSVKNRPIFMTNDSLSIGELETAWVSHIKTHLPHFPYRQNENEQRVRVSNALFNLTGFQLHGTSKMVGTSAYPGSRSYYAIESVDFTLATSKRLNGSSGTISLFEKAGFDGESFRIKSHQLRHYLNTLAQNKEIAETIIAKWSGRASVAQNAVYDHRTDEEKAFKIAEVYNHLNVEVVNVPVTVEEFQAKTGKIAEKMDTGFCIQDLNFNPCTKLYSCVGCPSSCHTKGDNAASDLLGENSQYILDRIHILLRQPLQLQSRKDHLALLKKQYLKHEALLCAFRDPRVEEGAVIRFAHDEGYVLRITNAEVSEHIEYKPDLPALPEPTDAKAAINALPKAPTKLELLVKSYSQKESDVTILTRFLEAK